MKKSKTRLYIKKQISSNLLIYVKNKQHHFLKNVLRIKINDIVHVFDGITGEWESKVLTINRNNIVLRVSKKIKELEKISDIWLIFSPIKKTRMSIAVQKATELGVSKIIPCLTEFTDIFALNRESLKLNAIEAAEQSRRLEVPEIIEPIKLTSILQDWPNDRYIIYCDENLDTDTSITKVLKNIKGKCNKWAVLVGPEGGFSEDEKRIITEQKRSFAVSLGKRVLRSDTAIIVALYCVQELAR